MRYPPSGLAGAIFLPLLLAGCVSGQGASIGSATVQDIAISGERVHPESITSDRAGNIYTGSISGTIYRALAGRQVAEPWIVADAENGLQSLFGVLADDKDGLLWTCSNPAFGAPPQEGAVSSLKAFQLKTGALAESYDFPSGQPAACNDIAIGPDRTVWATETAGGRIFVRRPGSEELALFAAGEELVGVDGIAFAADGQVYINNVRENLFQRVELGPDGAYAGLTTLSLSQQLDGPDGLRPLGGNRFLQAEGPGGRVALIEVSGDSATVTPVRTGLDSSPGVTRVGNVGYATEGKIGYLFDPALRGQDPGQFVIRAFPLPEGL